jgi:protein TonB
MEEKKSSKANLENKKAVFMQIGLVMVLSISLIGFEWTTTEVNLDTSLFENEIILEEEIVPITTQEEHKPPPPPPPQATDVLNIVEDDVDLDEELDIIDLDWESEREFDFTIQMDLEDEGREDTEIFLIVEEMPEFPGGEAALNKYLASAIRYPPIAQENGISGRVTVNFVVGPTGEITNVTVVRGVDPSLDREAVRVCQAMPKWKPGKQRNKPVRVSYNVPINFRLEQ